MNVGLYSGAAGMRMGQDYQELVTENLAMQAVPGYKQTLPVFTTDPTASTQGSLTASGNPAAVQMKRVVDFSQGPIQPAASPYHMAIEGKGFFEVNIRYGFFETPDIPAALENARKFGLALDVDTTTFFLGHETLVPSANPGLRRWQIALYMWLASNALSPARFFRLPPNRVVELGTQVSI